MRIKYLALRYIAIPAIQSLTRLVYWTADKINGFTEWIIERRK